MMDVQEGIEAMMEVSRKWQEVQKLMRQEESVEDSELNWGIGRLEM